MAHSQPQHILASKEELHSLFAPDLLQCSSELLRRKGAGGHPHQVKPIQTLLILGTLFVSQLGACRAQFWNHHCDPQSVRWYPLYWSCVFPFVTGGLCPGSNDPCMEKPCPGDMQCVGYEASRRPFLCQCPPGKLGECSGAEWGGMTRV